MKKKSIFALLLALCMMLSVFCVPVFALEPGPISDEEYLQQRALQLAKNNAAVLYEDIDPDNLTLTGPYQIYASVKVPLTAQEAYAQNALDMFCDEENQDNYKLFFVYHNDEPLTYMVLDKYDGDWHMAGVGGLDLNILLAKKEEMEKQFPDEEIGYFFSSDGVVMLFTPERANGYLLLTSSSAGYNAEEGALVRTRDYAIATYQIIRDIYQLLEDTGMTVQEYKSTVPLGGYPKHIVNLMEGKTYPVWPFWLPRIGIPVAVVLILAGAVIFIVRRRKKKAE